MNIIPAHALPKVSMKRIHDHWSGGTYTPNIAYDKKAYHFLVAFINNQAQLVLGTPTIDKNSGRLKDGYSAHTLNANTDSISVSVACMAGATEAPFNSGNFPMRREQFDFMCRINAELSAAYGIPVTNKTVLSHAEVQPNLGITQRWKWDFTRLSFEPDIRGAKACGDYMRELTLQHLNRVDKIVYNPRDIEDDGKMDTNPIPEGALVEITVATANFRKAPSMTSEFTPLPRGVRLRVLGMNGNWLHCQTPLGYKGYLSKELVVAVDGPEVEQPTTPDYSRLMIGDIRKVLDEYEAKLG